MKMPLNTNQMLLALQPFTLRKEFLKSKTFK